MVDLAAELPVPIAAQIAVVQQEQILAEEIIIITATTVKILEIAVVTVAAQEAA